MTKLASRSFSVSRLSSLVPMHQGADSLVRRGSRYLMGVWFSALINQEGVPIVLQIDSRYVFDGCYGLSSLIKQECQENAPFFVGKLG